MHESLGKPAQGIYTESRLSSNENEISRSHSEKIDKTQSLSSNRSFVSKDLDLNSFWWPHQSTNPTVGTKLVSCGIAAFEGAPEEIDVTVFPADGEAAASAERGAKALVAEAHQARQFTDVASFTLRCAP